MCVFFTKPRALAERDDEPFLSFAKGFHRRFANPYRATRVIRRSRERDVLGELSERHGELTRLRPNHSIDLRFLL